MNLIEIYCYAHNRIFDDIYIILIQCHCMKQGMVSPQPFSIEKGMVNGFKDRKCTVRPFHYIAFHIFESAVDI